jgi:hypothetical protein
MKILQKLREEGLKHAFFEKAVEDFRDLGYNLR